ncbi:MAG TPA: type III pantothenate kinase [Thiobacillaceae bacterium]|nr:type III pantothenate kinase [Thiobacillaceae bacterium]
MILLVDAGNTRLKWAAWRDGRCRDRGAVPVGEAGGQAARWAGLAPRWVGVSCVAGDDIRAVLEHTLHGLGVPVFWLVSRAAGFGIRNGYARPEQLGSDRFATLIACQRLGLTPCVVAGIGTAVTVDALTGEGEFLGGLILPGLGLMRAALRGGTAGVRTAADGMAGVTADFPTATDSGVETGIRLAVAGAVREMHHRLGARLGRPAGVVLTGGDAALLAGDIGISAQVRDDLVLEGLRWVAADLGVPGGGGDREERDEEVRGQA